MTNSQRDQIGISVKIAGHTTARCPLVLRLFDVEGALDFDEERMSHHGRLEEVAGEGSFKG